MIDKLIDWAIRFRWLVILGTVVLTFWIFRTITTMPVDVFPAFAPPQVEIETEAPGLAPEEVESLVTLPIESAINGAPGLDTVRSSSAPGISAVRAIFDWHTDIYQARQLITERLQQAQSKLPAGVEPPQLAPISSPIGTILNFALTIHPPKEATAPATATSMMELRRLVDWQLTNRLLATPGVANVMVFGGDIRQYQVLVDPAKLQAFDVSLQQVNEATAAANANAPGGFLITPDQEKLIRGIGRVSSIADLEHAVITARSGTPVRLGDVATVKIAPALMRSDASVGGERAIIVLVNKQPQADTPTVTNAVLQAMAEVQSGLPKDVKVRTTFRQADYIDASLDNVRSAVVEGGIIVAAILIPFLMHWRSLVVCLVALPLSLLIGVLALNWVGQGLNTMTLGGLAVAIGSAVDDAIVYTENAVRCLRENRQLEQPRPVLEVIFQSFQEVGNSVFGATLITLVVFAPIFTLSGVEGRIFTPMGIGYVMAVLASSLTALSITPALTAVLLPYGKLPAGEPWLARFFKLLYEPLLLFALRNYKLVVFPALALVVGSLLILPNLGRIFLPEFQEQTLVNAIALYPGTSLAATTRAGYALEMALKDDPYIQVVQTRSGRVLGDGGEGSSNLAHVDVDISPLGMKQRQAALARIREEFGKLPGVAPSIGGFISHRMDEVLSGVRSQIAVKVFGPDLDQLRRLSEKITAAMQTVPGVVDLQPEPQVPIPQVQIQFDRVAAARYGLSVGQLAETVETALNGKVVSQVLESQQTFDLLVWLKPELRNNLGAIERLMIDTPAGAKIPLAQVAQITNGTGPNTINRDNVSRRLVVAANVSGRDLRSVVREIQQRVKQEVPLPSGYYIQYGGQFEAEERASQNILIYSLIAFAVITVLMYLSVKSIASTVMIMINLPIGLVGGVIAVALTGGVISVASLVGFVTLLGVATRNGLLLVDNYNSKHAEGMPLKEVLFAGSMERLNAILMTAFTSALGLLPLVIAGGPGKEILQPLSVVVLGGLFTSTALTLLIIPALYVRFGKYIFPAPVFNSSAAQPAAEPPLPVLPEPLSKSS
jgi:cation efflux system protein involved in nickel and cobalt tolerance